MRKLLFVVCFVLLGASVSMAQDKLESQWNCGKPTVSHSIDVGDQPNHSYGISQMNCTGEKGEVGGVKEKEGIGSAFDENTCNATHWHGMFVVTMANGDKLHYTSGGKGTTKDGQFQSGTSTWSIVGGTGKFKGAKGKGSCTGKGSPDGSATWTCSGTYSLCEVAARANKAATHLTEAPESYPCFCRAGQGAFGGVP